ncbi:hypothetical protein [Sabulicella rubraurantiaca]|uniref:hypothetical protein n=1 Tax=Sabulicella rubraurantiaca TaxID=2811429 RepID=UPI001A969960|nr:hypothetical protein [Sabulicella rubraurantiaca]
MTADFSPSHPFDEVLLALDVKAARDAELHSAFQANGEWVVSGLMHDMREELQKANERLCQRGLRLEYGEGGFGSQPDASKAFQDLLLSKGYGYAYKTITKLEFCLSESADIELRTASGDVFRTYQVPPKPDVLIEDLAAACRAALGI